MEENNNLTGYIETYKDGFVRGWAAMTVDLVRPNQIDLFIDEKFISTIEAKLYREDLKDASVRFGVGGFLAPIPISLCDNQEHLITIKKTNTNLVIDKKNLVLARIRHLTTVDGDIVYEKTNSSFVKDQKLLFIAGFSNSNKLLAYQKALITIFREAGFYVVYILASDQPEKQFAILADADKVIVRNNMGYDFGSWATAYKLCQQEFIMAAEVLWTNDSIVGPIAPIDQLLNKINHSSSDIWAITDSHARQYHFQSYFWGLKKKPNHFQPILDAFFYYRCELPQEKEEAIANYEVKALSFFKDQDLSIEILFPEQALISIAEKFFISELEAYSTKWQPFFDMNLSKKTRKKMNEGLVNLATTLIKRQSTNPSHMYWNALIDQGFPFIKMELLTLNPSNYPFPEQFRRVFEKYNSIELLDDLADSYDFSTII